MEKHKCKLCYRTFGNGRALGGHMRSHMLNLYVPPKSDQLSGQLGDEYESTQSSSSSSSDDDDDDDDVEEEDKGLLNYKLRENPKKSFRLVDPEFSFSGGGAVVLQDRESETESFKYHSSIRRRSKRIQKSYPDMEINDDQELFSSKKQKISTTTKQLSCFETEPVSSVSDTTSDEDLAYCLIMMSRDKWRSPERKFNKYISMDYFLNDHQNIDEEEDEDEDEEEEEEVVIKSNKTSTRSKGKYKCETCDRVFKSYQALGGHRASHKKTRAMNVYQKDHNDVNGSSTVAPEEKIHECPVCFRVFASGQALGGHKRSHGIGSTTGIMATSTAAVTATTNNNIINNNNNSGYKFGGETIDLNLPAPVDEDEFSSQVEISAVSDTTEFVHP